MRMLPSVTSTGPVGSTLIASMTARITALGVDPVAPGTHPLG